MLFSFAIFVSIFTGDCWLPVAHISSAQLCPFIDQSTFAPDADVAVPVRVGDVPGGDGGGLTTEGLGGFGGVTTGGVVGLVGAIVDIFPYDLYAVTKELNTKANK